MIINFLLPWNPEDGNAWSGTPKGLHTALRKRAEIKTICVRKQAKTKIGTAAQKISEPLFGYRNAEKIINSRNDVSGAFLAFGEYSSKYISKTFCYQDLSVDFVVRQLEDKDSGYSYMPSLKRRVWLVQHKLKRRKANLFYQNCAGIFTMSEWLREDMINNLNIPEDKVLHVGGGCNVDVSLIDYSKKQGNRFLFVGRNWERKNGDLVVRAFKLLREKCPDMDPELYIIGPEQEPETVKGVSSVHFLGKLSYREVSDYYNLCDYFVMPSKIEAYGLVFAEALIYGLPCIGGDRFAMPEFIQNNKNGYLVSEDSTEKLCSAMERLLINGGELSLNVRGKRDEYIKKYSWDSVAERMLQAINAKQIS